MTLGLLTCRPGTISCSGVGLPVLEWEFPQGGGDQPLLGISAWRGGDRQAFHPESHYCTYCQPPCIIESGVHGLFHASSVREEKKGPRKTAVA
jgi:hypothetical protein